MTNNVYPAYTNAVIETRAERGAGDGLYAEATLYDLLKNQLPPEWSFLWGLQLGEHEYDFLIIVPGRGLVNMECKGDGYQYSPGNNFTVYNPKEQQRKEKDLLGQAAGAASYYINYLREHLFGPRYQWGLMGKCVVFPINSYNIDFRHLGLPVYDQDDCTEFSYKGKVGLTAIVEKSLDDAEFFLKNEQKVWNPKQLSVQDAKKIWNFWISPPQRRYQTRQFKINLEEFKKQMVNCLTPLQATILGTISDSGKNNILVTGAAGTGKSVLAQAAASILPGRKLYVCFNKVLACYSRFLLPEIPDLDIRHFHKLDELLLKKRIVCRNENGDVDWTCTDQAMLVEARKCTPDKKYDCIIIDEAQDLTENQLRFLLRFRKNQGKIILFSSTEQQIYQEHLTYDRLNKFLPKLDICSLKVNLRNTIQIDRYCQHMLQNPHETATLQGPEVVENVTLPKDQINQFLKEQVMSSFQPCEIAVLSPEKDLLNNVTHDTGISFYGPDEKSLTKTEKNLQSWLKNEAAWKSTTQSFKGLEAMVIVHLIPENFSEHFVNTLYVGCSRASYKLYIVNIQG